MFLYYGKLCLLYALREKFTETYSRQSKFVLNWELKRKFLCNKENYIWFKCVLPYFKDLLKFKDLGADSQKNLRYRNLQGTENWHIFWKWWAKCMAMNKKLFVLYCKLYQYTFKKQKQLSYRRKINRNVAYYDLKWRNKITVSDIWHKI